MQKRFLSFVAAVTTCWLLMVPANASLPEGESTGVLDTPENSALWQHLFIERKRTEEYPSTILGDAIDVREPFATQIQRTLQIFTTRAQYWIPGRVEPKSEDIALQVSFTCNVTRQHWPVKTMFDDRCSTAIVQSDWLSAGGVSMLTSFFNHYWSRSPRIHQQLLAQSVWDRKEDEQALKTEISINANLSITFHDLTKLSAYFFSHRIITEKKLREQPKLRAQLEVYYEHADLPELKQLK